MDIQVGQVVFSKSGHDKGDIFLVYAVEREYLYLVDGKKRPLQKPKRKKQKHVQPTGFIFQGLGQKLLDKEYVLDATVVKALKEYQTGNHEIHDCT